MELDLRGGVHLEIVWTSSWEKTTWTESEGYVVQTTIRQDSNRWEASRQVYGNIWREGGTLNAWAFPIRGRDYIDECARTITFKYGYVTFIIRHLSPPDYVLVDLQISSIAIIWNIDRRVTRVSRTAVLVYGNFPGVLVLYVLLKLHCMSISVIPGR